MTQTCTAFIGTTRAARGTPAELIGALHGREQGVLVFDDATGRPVDLDWRGVAAPAPEESEAPRRRGRPKLGVVAREVTLLPRQWDWLSQQPGGASQALRRLVDEARKADHGRTARRMAHERAYRVMSALGGDLPGFEEASRLLFADRLEDFAKALAPWPGDLRDHVLELAQPSLED
ncbi:hypothetical protein EDF56_104517 [Novosphingobium sp. PhB165]|uniref:DUF2239 family protein n=1 Tax=Novosphingobium sp. PhB165 TaxID=2485105 RepID=UPI001044FC9D|nr:DUF2239 family protein [Novosphingobium sp. PhB165]TCM18982.1 hypothetical protein EDF56_104517 [Novosphingobium sp. PhB165]